MLGPTASPPLPALPRPRLNSLQWLRGFAALAILAFHLHYITELRLGVSGGVPAVRGGVIGVQVFFVLSGFIIHFVHADIIGKREWTAWYLARRFIRLYPVYWVLTLAVFVTAFALPGVMNDYKKSPGYLLESMLLVPLGTAHGLPILPVAWSLFHEVKFYALFALCIALPRRAATVLLIGVFGGTAWNTISLLGSGASPETIARMPWLTFLFDPFNLLFAAGCGVSAWVASHRSSCSGSRFLAIGAVCGLVFVVVAYGLGCMSQNTGTILAVGGLSALLISGLVGWEHSAPRGWHHRGLTLLGDASYSIYLVHLPVYELVTRMFKGLARHQPMSDVWLLLTLPFVGVLAGVVVHLFLERPLLKWLSPWGRRWLPERPLAS